MEDDRFKSRLSAYKDGELDGDTLEEISLHLLYCGACREELAEFERIDSLLKEMPELEPGGCFPLEIIAGVLAKKREHPDFVPFLERIFAKVLQLADSIFELISGHESKRTAVLDEFGDFPPLSLSHAYFNVTGRHR